MKLGGERALAACLLAAVGALCVLETRSETARALRAGTPVVVLASVADGAGEGTPQAYLLAYHGRERSADLVLLPRARDRSAETARRHGSRREAVTALLREAEREADPDPDGPRELPRPRFWAEAELPPGAGPADSPRAVRAWLAGSPRGARFAVEALRAAAAARGSGLPETPSWYDAVLLALEAYRLKMTAVRAAWLPEGASAVPYLERILGGSPEAPPQEVVTVEVLNASGQAGVAMRATKVLRWRGLDVVEFGNAPGAEATTGFVDRTGRPEAALRVAQSMGCPEPEIVTRIEPSPRAAVSAVLGRDWEACSALRAERTE